MDHIPLIIIYIYEENYVMKYLFKLEVKFVFIINLI